MKAKYQTAGNFYKRGLSLRTKEPEKDEPKEKVVRKPKPFSRQKMTQQAFNMSKMNKGNVNHIILSNIKKLNNFTNQNPNKKLQDFSVSGSEDEATKQEAMILIPPKFSKTTTSRGFFPKKSQQQPESTTLGKRKVKRRVKRYLKLLSESFEYGDFCEEYKHSRSPSPSLKDRIGNLSLIENAEKHRLIDFSSSQRRDKQVEIQPTSSFK